MKFIITKHSTEGELIGTQEKEFKTLEELLSYIDKRKRNRDKVDVTTIEKSGWLQVTQKYYPF